MLVYRITIEKYSGALFASGIPGRWNPKDVRMIYTAGSRALACLENIVHRNSLGLSAIFRTMVVEIPNHLAIESIYLADLPLDWSEFASYPITQELGAQWIRSNRTAVLCVPSAIVPNDSNYLLNPAHPDFSQIVLKGIEPFKFDSRIMH